MNPASLSISGQLEVRSTRHQRANQVTHNLTKFGTFFTSHNGLKSNDTFEISENKKSGSMKSCSQIDKIPLVSCHLPSKIAQLSKLSSTIKYHHLLKKKVANWVWRFKVTGMHFSWLQIIMTSSIMEKQESKRQGEREKLRSWRGWRLNKGRKNRKLLRLSREIPKASNNFCYHGLTFKHSHFTRS